MGGAAVHPAKNVPSNYWYPSVAYSVWSSICAEHWTHAIKKKETEYFSMGNTH